MSIQEKVVELKKIIDLVIHLLPEIVSLVKELIVSIREIKGV